MNWLIYISGWFLGWAIFNGYIKSEDDSLFRTKIMIWTMLWIWICWKFISKI